MNLFINGFTYISEVFIIYTYAAGMLDKKYSTIKILLIGLGIFTIPFILNQLWNNSIINIISFFIATTVYLYLTHRIKIQHGILQGLILTAIMFVTEMICSYSISLMFGQNSFYAYRDSTQVFILCSIVSKIFFLVACKICTHFILQKNKLYTTPASYFIFSFTAILSMFVFILINGRYKFNDALQILIIATSILLMSCLVLLFISHERNAVKNAEYMDMKAIKQAQETDNKYFEILERQNNNLMVYAHDTKNHLQAIRNMTDDENIIEYLERLSADLNKYSRQASSGNHNLDVIINKYITECEIKGVEFTYDVRLSNLSGIQMFDLVSILGNLLDNALESAEKSKQKSIHLQTDHRNTYDVIIVTNSCDTKPVTQWNVLKSSKANKKQHGLGIKSIKSALKKYDGDYNWEYNEQNKEFISTVMILRK